MHSSHMYEDAAYVEGTGSAARAKWSSQCAPLLSIDAPASFGFGEARTLYYIGILDIRNHPGGSKHYAL